MGRKDKGGVGRISDRGRMDLREARIIREG